RLLQGKLDRPFSRGKFRKIIPEGSHRRRRWIEADAMFVCGERNQYPPIGKGGHPPLQALLGPGSRCANAGTHFTQFLLSLFGGGMDVLGDAFRPRFFGNHDFILSTLLLILQSLLLAAYRQLPMGLPRQVRSWKSQATQTASVS